MHQPPVWPSERCAASCRSVMLCELSWPESCAYHGSQTASIRAYAPVTPLIHDTGQGNWRYLFGSQSRSLGRTKPNAAGVVRTLCCSPRSFQGSKLLICMWQVCFCYKESHGELSRESGGHCRIAAAKPSDLHVKRTFPRPSGTTRVFLTA